MITKLFLLEENQKPNFLTEFNEPDIPLMEGNLLVLTENGGNIEGIYEVLSEIYAVNIWEKKADTTRNLFIVKSVIDKDLNLKKEMLSNLGGE